jgi:hypothetical protein
MNHRESWAEERHAPSFEEWKRILSGEAEEKKPRAKKDEATVVATPEQKVSSAPSVILRRRT